MEHSFGDENFLIYTGSICGRHSLEKKTKLKSFIITGFKMLARTRIHLIYRKNTNSMN